MRGAPRAANASACEIASDGLTADAGGEFIAGSPAANLATGGRSGSPVVQAQTPVRALVRQQADTSFASLSRRRADLASAHFGLIFVMKPAQTDANPVSSHSNAGGLGFAVPKRLLAHAVDRNTVKRVAREAWRLAAWGSVPRPILAMVKLRSLDPGWKAMPASAWKKAMRVELDALVGRLVRRLA